MGKYLIDHVGFLVPNLEEAIERWSAATGYDFRAPSRYTVEDYRDESNPEPHLHDARLSMSVQGPPYIELMEFHGSGTHAANDGPAWHHLGFYDEDMPGKITQLSGQGIRLDGEAYDAEGRVLLCFTNAADLDGVRLEFNDPHLLHPWFDEATGAQLTE